MNTLNAFLAQLLRTSEPASVESTSTGLNGTTPTGWVALPWEGLQFTADTTSDADIAAGADAYLRSLAASEHARH